MTYKLPPLPAQPFNLVTQPYSSDKVWGTLESTQSSFGEELGILYDNKTTYPSGRGIQQTDLGTLP